MKSEPIRLKLLILDLAIIVLFLGTITFLFKYVGFIDSKSHNSFLIDYLAKGYFPIPPGYYFTIYVVDLFIRIKYPYVVSSILILTFFYWWKYKLVYKWIAHSLNIKKKLVFLITLSFLFVSPIYIPIIDGEFWYLGKFTQTIWHNSTLICVFPLCILLTHYTLRWVEDPLLKTLYIMGVIGILILLIKPSFLFCYIPALPLYVIVKDRKLSKHFFESLGLVLVLFLLILAEKYLIFSWDPMIDQLYTVEERSNVVIRPFRVWLFFSHEPVFDFISSFPLLLTFLIFWRKEAFHINFFNFTLILLLFSLLVFFLLAETGYREFHSNFYWQVPIALFLNSLSILIHVLREFTASENNLKIKYIAVFSIYTVQVLLGVGYWARIFIERTLS